MHDLAHLDWPFFDPEHRALARQAADWAAGHLADPHPGDVDAACRALARRLGQAGWLAHVIPAEQGDTRPRLDTRSICLLREILAFREPLADFVLAMQGLGSVPIALVGTAEQRRRFLPPVATGEWIAALALTEPEAGSDLAAMTTTARRDGDGWVLDGEKTWISNGGIADFYTVVARTDPAAGTRGFGAFVVEAGTAGLEIAERLEVVAPHPLARLVFRDCRVPDGARLGAPGDGFRLALRTLDLFRPSVAAAALGMARRAFAEALAHARSRRMFGGTLAQLQLTQARLADMATALDASALLTYRAAWLGDTTGARTTREAAMAKLTATESAQRIIDGAVQLFGGRGVRRGEVVERLYREIRSLRIYEGATEVQQMVIAREILRAADTGGAA